FFHLAVDLAAVVRAVAQAETGWIGNVARERRLTDQRAVHVIQEIAAARGGHGDMIPLTDFPRLSDLVDLVPAAAIRAQHDVQAPAVRVLERDTGREVVYAREAGEDLEVLAGRARIQPAPKLDREVAGEGGIDLVRGNPRVLRAGE